MAHEERIQIGRIIDDLESFTERAVITVALDVQSSVVPVTPIDTGWARSNWIIYPGNAPDRPVGEGRTPAGVSAARAAQANGIARLFAYRLRQGIVYIVNNVRYINILNEGTFSHIPAGFVQTAIARAVAMFRRFRG